MSNRFLLRSIFVVALVSTLGSLYYGYFGDPVIALQTGVFFSKEMGLPPCEMCWYARILMYPLVFLSGISLLQKNYLSVGLTSLVFSVGGLLLMVYLYGMQKFGLTSFTCDWRSAVSGYDVSVDYFGFITIPFLAGLGFLLIALCGGILHYRNRH